MNTLRIYGAHWCSFCNTAVDIAEAKNIPVEYIDLDDDTTLHVGIHRRFFNDERHTSIPQIYELNEDDNQFKRYIGGFAELKAILST